MRQGAGGIGTGTPPCNQRPVAHSTCRELTRRYERQVAQSAYAINRLASHRKWKKSSSRVANRIPPKLASRSPPKRSPSFGAFRAVCSRRCAAHRAQPPRISRCAALAARRAIATNLCNSSWSKQFELEVESISFSGRAPARARLGKPAQGLLLY
jgi:hypothetical protein